MKFSILFTTACFLFNYVSEVAPEPRPPKKNRESFSQLHESGMNSHDRSLSQSVQAYDDYRSSVKNGTWNSTQSKPTIKPFGDYPNDEYENVEREKGGGGKGQGRGLRNNGQNPTTLSSLYDDSDETNNKKAKKNSNTNKNDNYEFPFEDF